MARWLKRIQIKVRKKGTCFLLPSVAGVMTFFFVPFLIVIYYSLLDNPINKRFVFLQNFVGILNNKAFQQAVGNTVAFSLVAVPLSILLSLGLALLLERNMPGKSCFRTFFLSPLMVPTASIILIWQILFRYYGVGNEILGFFHLEAVDWFKSDYSQVTILLLFLWRNLGYNMILFMAALASIPQEVMEVTWLDGNNRLLIFLHVKLRYLLPTVFFVGIMSLINTFKVFRETYLLVGDYPYDRLYLLQHFMNNTFRNLDYQKLSTAAILMSVVMVVIIGILFLLENYFGRDVEG